jgi:membrane protein involved in colicin uptake
MSRSTLAVVLSVCAGAASAAIPTINATCPTNIDLHVDAGGYAYINGKESNVETFSDTAFDVHHGGITVSVLLNPDGTATVSYTRRTGANGICQATVSR